MCLPPPKKTRPLSQEHSPSLVDTFLTHLHKNNSTLTRHASSLKDRPTPTSTRPSHNELPLVKTCSLPRQAHSLDKSHPTRKRSLRTLLSQLYASSHKFMPPAKTHLLHQIVPLHATGTLLLPQGYCLFLKYWRPRAGYSPSNKDSSYKMRSPPIRHTSCHKDTPPGHVLFHKDTLALMNICK